MRVSNEPEYESRADAFLGGPKKLLTLECKRRSGHLLRYNIWTKEFGVVTSGGIILTYYRPEKRIHKKLTNLCYFLEECGK